MHVCFVKLFLSIFWFDLLPFLFLGYFWRSSAKCYGYFALCLVVTSFYLSVKYLREVTPYIRKTSLLAGIGWEEQKPFLGSAPSSDVVNEHQTINRPSSQTRSIPLMLCHLARPLKVPTEDNHKLEIRSPDGQQSCILRAPDAPQASQW